MVQPGAGLLEEGHHLELTGVFLKLEAIRRLPAQLLWTLE